MNYQLEIIPVHDAWASDAVCPLCSLINAAEQRHVKYFLGNSVMNPETRVLVNKKGFCSRHFPMLREAGHAHHLGLIGHTHLAQLRKSLGPAIKSLKSASSARNVTTFSTRIRQSVESCLICESLDRDIERYSCTAAILYGRETEFRELFEKSTGPCLPHAADLADIAVKVLNRKLQKEFLGALSDKLVSLMEKLEADILYFTQKFDAQNDNLPWDDKKNAHARVVQFLSGSQLRIDD